MPGLLARAVDRTVNAMAIVSGLILGGLVIVTFIDVILRYIFSAPLSGRQDIVEMGMLTSLMFAAPLTWRIGGHISVDLYETLPVPFLESVRRILVMGGCAGILGLLAWRSVEAADDAALFSEATNMIHIPHQPFIYLILVASAAHALVILAELFRLIPPSAAGERVE